MIKKEKKAIKPIIKQIIAENSPYQFFLIKQYNKEIAYFHSQEDANEYVEYLIFKNKLLCIK